MIDTMDTPLRRTKIVATIGPASRSPEVLRKLIVAGVDAVRLNFSHGSHEDHAHTIAAVRAISSELGTPTTVLQDLQGPKVRVGDLPGGQCPLAQDDRVLLVPAAGYGGEAGAIPIDYEYAARDAQPGQKVLLADGQFELRVTGIEGEALRCRVIEGGELLSRKGVNFPDLDLRLPSLTGKDLLDLDFGISQGVDWISLSFVRRADDVLALKRELAGRGAAKPVMAKIEKPQAVAHIEEILRVVEGVMVARGDLGVEMSPEKVPMLQKRIIELCNRRGVPVVTATQMLESMMHEPRPTRAEASDVANAIIDGTDAVMLSGESAVGEFPVRAVEMMSRIAQEVESRTRFRAYPPAEHTGRHAISEAVHVVEELIRPRCIVMPAVNCDAARLTAAERPSAPVVAITPDPGVYHALNLIWGVRPVFVRDRAGSFDGFLTLAESALRRHGLAADGDRILVLGGLPGGEVVDPNVLAIHTVGANPGAAQRPFDSK